MKLVVISHTPHYIRGDDVVGWGPTVREIDALATCADRVVHIAPLHDEAPPESALPYEMPNIRVRHVPATGGETYAAKLGVIRALPSYALAILREIRDADLVHVRCPAHISLAALLLTGAGRTRRQWIKYAGSWAQTQSDPWSYRLQRHLLLKPAKNRLVTINGRWPDQPAHVHSLKNPCLSDAELLAGADAGRGKQLTSPIALLFVGALLPGKGVALLPVILSALRTSGVSATLDIVGDGPERRGIEDRVRSLRLEDSLTLRGWMPREALAGCYGRAHFLLLPSRSEGWPKVLSEGMAYGVVPIASRVGSIPEYLTEAGTGVVVDPLDIDGYANAIRAYVDDPARWMEESGRGLASARAFSYRIYLESIKRLCGLVTDN